MSRYHAKYVNPGDVEIEITIRLTSAQWQKVREQLEGHYLYPMSVLADAIRHSTARLEANVEGTLTDQSP